MRIIWMLCLSVLLMGAQAQTKQNEPVTKANYALAARFSPKKLEKMLFSTSVDPRWLKKGDRFWYSYKTSQGTQWYIVDAAKAEKKRMFDNAKLASELTKVVKDPFDAQNLGLDSLKFVKDENWIQFQVKSSLEVEKKDTGRRATPAVKEKKTFYFEYNLSTGELVELKDFKRPARRPQWASISPDSSYVVFGRNYNLYMMDKANFEKAMKNEVDSTIVETQLTKDGILNYSYYSEGNLSGSGQTNVDQERNAKRRRSVFVYWSPDGKYFTMNRVDNRKVKDLWVINSIAEPRPTLETYKYWMPGEKDAPVDHLYVFDVAAKQGKELDITQFKDQSLAIWSAPAKPSSRDDEFRPLLWHGTAQKFYIARTSRDLKRIDICEVDVQAGKVKAVIEERLNTYVEIRRLGLVNGGQEMIQWSERDGWGH